MVDPAQIELQDFLREHELLARDEPLRCRELAGGVSSDIWLVDAECGRMCVKRALPKLKVAADWRAPVERNVYEVAWIQLAGEIAPASAPRVLAHDDVRGMFAMNYLEPAAHPLWKEELRKGRIDSAFAAAVGNTLGRIHSRTANSDEMAARFPTDRIFRAIRLDPYLAETARRHPDRADALLELAEVTATTHRALVHGDVSPKNILVGPRGTPVFLDAECAWYGDPAFDLAFCLNHLMLKCLWTPSAAAGFLDGFEALSTAYLAGVDWEDPSDLEARAARLLPGLFLARVDGKSPVEYLIVDGEKESVRRTARRLLAAPVARLAEVSSQWRQEISPIGGSA